MAEIAIPTELGTTTLELRKRGLSPRSALPRCVLVVGASAAGLSVVRGLRARGYQGRISVIGAEQEWPYDRPPLTKQLLAGTWTPEKVDLLRPSQLADLSVEFLLGRRAVGLDLATSTITTDDGEQHGSLQALVIATATQHRNAFRNQT